MRSQKIRILEKKVIQGCAVDAQIREKPKPIDGHPKETMHYRQHKTCNIIDKIILKDILK
jgi:hypothetical protein